MSNLKTSLKLPGIKRGDIVVIALLLALSAVIGAIMMIFSSPSSSAYAVITVDGNEICRLPLDEDCIYQIGDTNTIEISDGTVRMIDANCPDKICIHTGEISDSGHAIVCLPNRVVISVTGKASSADVYTN